jgi:hypothetical protein
MKVEYYKIRKNSTGFSDNGIRFKGECCKDLESDWFNSSNGRTHTHTSGDLNNLHFLLLGRKATYKIGSL